MSRDTMWCGDEDPHDAHTWTDKHEYDFDCDGVTDELAAKLADVDWILSAERDQMHTTLRETLDAIIAATRDQHVLMTSHFPHSPSQAEDMTLGWLMTEFDEGVDGENGLRLTRDNLATLAGFAILRLAAPSERSKWLPDDYDLAVATRVFHERAQAGAESTPREHCAAILDAIRLAKETTAPTQLSVTGEEQLSEIRKRAAEELRDETGKWIPEKPVAKSSSRSFPARVEGCDAIHPPVYLADDGETFICRCVVCARCGHHTGNSNQGHYWSLCTITGRDEEFHFCCPNACELHPASDPTITTTDITKSSTPTPNIPKFINFTMCSCGQNQRIADDPFSDNLFAPHINPRTGESCTGLPIRKTQEPDA